MLNFVFLATASILSLLSPWVPSSSNKNDRIVVVQKEVSSSKCVSENELLAAMNSIGNDGWVKLNPEVVPISKTTAKIKLAVMRPATDDPNYVYGVEINGVMDTENNTRTIVSVVFMSGESRTTYTHTGSKNGVECFAKSVKKNVKSK